MKRERSFHEPLCTEVGRERTDQERNLSGAKCFLSGEGLGFKTDEELHPSTYMDTFLRTRHQGPRLIIHFGAYFSWLIGLLSRLWQDRSKIIIHK